MGKLKHVYIIGSKGIPANYGGFETFVEKLTEYQVDQSIKYHVACMSENSAKSNIYEKHFEHNGADCFNVDVPKIGPARAIYYDVAALNYPIDLAKKNRDKKPIFYVLACRIGPFIGSIKKKIAQIDGKLFVNPDGHEWLRAKWSKPVRKYWKESERLMVKHADLLICDSKTIEKYIKSDYKQYTPKTTYIAYGTDTTPSKLKKEEKIVREWFIEKKIEENSYYLVVGRFVPENNFETMIREFMKSDTKKDLVLITNIEKNKFYKKLLKETHFDQDKRIKFVGTVYNQELLKYIRENAFAYIHGHEVGGTNPSLLEALSFTKMNLLLDIGFNKEVGRTGAVYWNKDTLAQKINYTDELSKEIFQNFEVIAKGNIKMAYTWENISNQYKKLFEGQ